MHKVRRACWETFKGLVAAVIGAAAIEVCHQMHWYPDKQLADLIMATPSLITSTLAYVTIVIVIAIPLLFAEHWLGPVISDWVKRRRRNDKPATTPEPQSAIATIKSQTGDSVDWPLRELFAYLAPHLPLRAAKTAGNTTIDALDNRWEAIGDVVLKQLSLGTLHASGRQYQRFNQLQTAPIPAEFWRTATFTYWFLDRDGTGVLHAKNRRGEEYSDIEVNSADVIAIWPPEVSLFEAATEAYGQTRGMDIAEAAERDSDHPLKWYVSYFISVAKTPLHGSVPFSPKRELINPKGFHPVVNANQIVLKADYGSRSWENITIRRADLNAAVERMLAWRGEL